MILLQLLVCKADVGWIGVRRARALMRAHLRALRHTDACAHMHTRAHRERPCEVTMAPPDLLEALSDISARLVELCLTRAPEEWHVDAILQQLGRCACNAKRRGRSLLQR